MMMSWEFLPDTMQTKHNARKADVDAARGEGEDVEAARESATGRLTMHCVALCGCQMRFLSSASGDRRGQTERQSPSPPVRGCSPQSLCLFRRT